MGCLVDFVIINILLVFFIFSKVLVAIVVLIIKDRESKVKLVSNWGNFGGNRVLMVFIDSVVKFLKRI